MRDFNNDSNYSAPRGRRFGGGGSRQSGNRSGGSSFGRRDFGSRDSNRGEMFDATCADCGNHCRVPFQPTGIKPVYCSDCFENHKDDERAVRPRGNFNRPSYQDRPNFPEKRSFSAPRTQEFDVKKLDVINAKLDQIMEAMGLTLAKPKSDKPKHAARKAAQAAAITKMPLAADFVQAPAEEPVSAPEPQTEAEAPAVQE